MKKNSIHITILPNILEEVDARGPQRSVTISRDLERLYTLYQRALRRLNLTIDEACLIVDVTNGTIYDVRSAGLLWGAVRDGIELEHLDEKWNVNGNALVQKLSALDEFSCLAIIDAAERFWANEKYRDMDIREGVAECFGISRG